MAETREVALEDGARVWALVQVVDGEIILCGDGADRDGYAKLLAAAITIALDAPPSPAVGGE